MENGGARQFEQRCVWMAWCEYRNRCCVDLHRLLARQEKHNVSIEKWPKLTFSSVGITVVERSWVSICLTELLWPKIIELTHTLTSICRASWSHNAANREFLRKKRKKKKQNKKQYQLKNTPVIWWCLTFRDQRVVEHDFCRRQNQSLLRKVWGQLHHDSQDSSAMSCRNTWH